MVIQIALYRLPNSRERVMQYAVFIACLQIIVCVYNIVGVGDYKYDNSKIKVYMYKSI